VPTLQAETLRELAQALFVAAGVPDDEAATVSRSLIGANLSGHDSHGVIRVSQYISFVREKRVFSGVSLDKMHETPALFAGDANWGWGQVQSYRLLDNLRPKAKALGIAAGTMRRCGHVGRLGEYAEWAAEQGFAFFATVNSHGANARVAPPGGIEGRLGTNPLCMGAPTTGDPLVLDMGTSAAAEGKIRLAFQKGEKVPEGWLQDRQGRPTTDPRTLYEEPKATMLPFGGQQAYKGFGLGLLLDAFAGALSGGQCTRGEAPFPGVGNAVLYVLFDIEHFGGREHFLGETSNLGAFVRSSATMEGVTAVTLPGDPERLTKQKRLAEGIPVAEATWSQLIRLADELGVRH
jgi:hydroxycarboxylate dehydrogenase B